MGGLNNEKEGEGKAWAKVREGSEIVDLGQKVLNFTIYSRLLICCWFWIDSISTSPSFSISEV
jgi:hypothetical protein